MVSQGGTSLNNNFNTPLFAPIKDDPRILLRNEIIQGICPIDLTVREIVPGRSGGYGNRPDPLGNFKAFPTETLWEIIESMSIVSLLRLRRTSRRWRSVIDRHQLFRTAVQHARGVILGLALTRPSKCPTLAQLLNKISNAHCEKCGAVSYSFYVPTFTRLCCSCSRAGRITLLDRFDLPEYCNIAGKEPDQIPSLRHPALTCFMDDDQQLHVPSGRLWVGRVDATERDPNPRMHSHIMKEKQWECKCWRVTPGPPNCPKHNKLPRRVQMAISHLFAPYVRDNQLDSGHYCVLCGACFTSTTRLDHNCYTHRRSCVNLPLNPDLHEFPLLSRFGKLFITEHGRLEYRLKARVEDAQI